MTRLREDYETRIRSALVDEFKYKSVMEVPMLEKIVLNMGVGEASQDRKKIDGAVAVSYTHLTLPTKRIV